MKNQTKKENSVCGKEFSRMSTVPIKKLYEKQLPPMEKFYSNLTEKNISDQDYSYAWKFWKLYDCKDLKMYAKRYCELDVIQLVEVFISFRSMIFDWAGLDACHYVGLPSLAYDIFLKGIILIIDILTFS